MVWLPAVLPHGLNVVPVISTPSTKNLPPAVEGLRVKLPPPVYIVWPSVNPVKEAFGVWITVKTTLEDTEPQSVLLVVVRRRVTVPVPVIFTPVVSEEELEKEATLA